MENVFVLIVTMQVKPEHVEEFRRRWAILAAFCAANEPRTLTYELVAVR
jgi:quinol monooxygenase YgiN